MTSVLANYHENSSCRVRDKQLIYLCGVKSMVVDLSNAVVVHVAAISRKISVNEGGNFWPDDLYDSSWKTLCLHSNVSFYQSVEGV